MSTAVKHFKFINSKTGNVIYYHSVSPELGAEKIKAELDRIKEQVAVGNGLYHGTVYWEEIKDEE
jgi:hypothetical protein